MGLASDQTIVDPGTDVDFTEEQHDIWRTLFAARRNRCRNMHAASIWRVLTTLDCLRTESLFGSMA
jgi:hypothetical protein